MDKETKVASFTDAWIETGMNKLSISVQPSHLLQMRGLKQRENKAHGADIVSHLLQMRGLKQ